MNPNELRILLTNNTRNKQYPTPMPTLEAKASVKIQLISKTHKIKFSGIMKNIFSTHKLKIN